MQSLISRHKESKDKRKLAAIAHRTLPVWWALTSRASLDNNTSSTIVTGIRLIESALAGICENEKQVLQVYACS